MATSTFVVPPVMASVEVQVMVLPTSEHEKPGPAIIAPMVSEPSRSSSTVLAAGLATTDGLPTAPPTATLVNVELPAKTMLPALHEVAADEATACAVKLSRLPSATLRFWTLPALCTEFAPSALELDALSVPLPTETAPERMLPRMLTDVPETLKSGGLLQRSRWAPDRARVLRADCR